MENNKCVLCGAEFKNDYDKNNAEPLKEGCCCTACNQFKVIPARLKLIAGAKTICEVK